MLPLLLRWHKMLPNLQPRLLKPPLPPWRNSLPLRLLLKRRSLLPPKLLLKWPSRQKPPLPLL